MNLLRTNSTNPDFIKLILLLDKELSIRDGDDHAFYDQFNKLDAIKHTVVAFNKDGQAVGCGAIKQYAPNVMEVKRMFVLLEQRGKGIAGKILNHLEIWAAALGNKKCILETGINQPEAIALYKKCNYTITENYGQYSKVATSICFEKILN
ncbi:MULTISPECIES: GNAT family N-acetyltransferase [Aequorivita]|uniref:GNAT family N-acetyltransferase n=2 Tax=Aequorivita TaxID=153265 RepID=A0AB35YYC8_9FLAO|nr:GNAT family N-acetyltransferase [Aequorivita sp. Ant34-E75]WGF93898.1 GNAT family N-acetyltransferase [Aequorivita sp. Ant34-E75]